MKRVTIQIPLELIECIISQLNDPQDIVTAISTCKSWYRVGIKHLYERVTFRSFNQREGFFKLLASDIKLSPTTLIPCLSSSPSRALKSPKSPTPTSIRPKRKTYLLRIFQPGLFVKRLDFGLGPRALILNNTIKGVTKKRRSGSINRKSSMMSIVESPVKQRRKGVAGSILTVNTASSSTLVESPVNSGMLTTSTSESYGNKWDHHFVSKYLETLTQFCPNLQVLSLAGCHIFDHAFEDTLKALPNLVHLDIAYTTLKKSGLESVAKYCRFHLETLDISGVFRLGRNDDDVVTNIVINCTKLKRIIANECPELYNDVAAECLRINPKLQLIRDTIIDDDDVN